MDHENPSSTNGITKLNRLYLWANDRSLGTVFLKWLSIHIQNAQVINGIFTSCFYYGTELQRSRVLREHYNTRAQETPLTDFPFVYDATACTYSWAKSQLECDYPGKDYLICKDLPYALCGNHEVIPRGFRHTFLIRHPYKMFSSWKRTFGKMYPNTSSLSDTIEENYYSYNYKEQYEVLKYLQEHPELGDPNPIVIDTDNLLSQPARVLSHYCQDIGVPYTDDMLQWTSGTDVVKRWKISSQLCGGGLHDSEWGFYKTAMESSYFLPPKKLPERSELEEDVLACADDVMPFYDKMYNMRTIRL